MIYKLKYFFDKFKFLQAYNSPFKPPMPRLYIGKINIGTPYFLPRKWVKSKVNPGYLMAVPKKIGFDFVGLGWKTKWDYTDYRFEWSPIWSFVFFKWQIAVTFTAPERDHYWTCWLCYTRDTDKSKSTKERIIQAKEIFPCIWECNKIKINYWDKILKDKWLKNSSI
jgi:hypothetical protein